MRKGVPEFAQRSKIMIVSRTELIATLGESQQAWLGADRCRIANYLRFCFRVDDIVDQIPSTNP